MTEEERLEKRAAACRLARANTKRKKDEAAVAAAQTQDGIVAAFLDELIIHTLNDQVPLTLAIVVKPGLNF